MATKQPTFLTKSYSAYHHSHLPREDELLTHVGPNTPCGEYMRRFWQPIALSQDLKDLPKAIRILGEDLVVFRNGEGRTGCLELHCSHRGTSLEFAVIEGDGIRCCYHGWMFGTDGKILDTPGEPLGSTYKERLCHGAYPTHEFGGLVFAYLGPPDKKPPFPMLDTFVLPGMRLVAGGGGIGACNWLQSAENIMDPVHTTFLHARSSTIQFSEGFLSIPEMDFRESPIGMMYIATRRVGDNVWLRMNDAIPPNLTQLNRNGEDGLTEHPFWTPWMTEWFVPVDDTHHTTFLLVRVPEEAEDPPRLMGELVADMDRPYEEQQRVPSDGQAILSQRPIAIHAMEHLAETDRGVIMFRNLVREGILAVQRGEDPPNLVRMRECGDTIPTYTNDTVTFYPQESDPQEDRKLLRELGWKWAEEYFQSHPPFLGAPPQ